MNIFYILFSISNNRISDLKDNLRSMYYHKKFILWPVKYTKTYLMDIFVKNIKIYIRLSKTRTYKCLKTQFLFN